MTQKRSLVQIIVGALLMVLAAVLAFLMMVRLAPPSLGLSLVAYSMSVGGLITGLIGALGYFRPSGRDGER